MLWAISKIFSQLVPHIVNKAFIVCLSCREHCNAPRKPLVSGRQECITQTNEILSIIKPTPPPVKSENLTGGQGILDAVTNGCFQCNIWSQSSDLYTLKFTVAFWVCTGWSSQTALTSPTDWEHQGLVWGTDINLSFIVTRAEIKTTVFVLYVDRFFWSSLKDFKNDGISYL